jgi:hypothetical protein
LLFFKAIVFLLRRIVDDDDRLHKNIVREGVTEDVMVFSARCRDVG